LREDADNIELDLEEFSRCLDEGQMRKKVKIDMRRVGEFGLSMPPAFWINAETILASPTTGVFIHSALIFRMQRLFQALEKLYDKHL